MVEQANPDSVNGACSVEICPAANTIVVHPQHCWDRLIRITLLTSCSNFFVVLFFTILKKHYNNNIPLVRENVELSNFKNEINQTFFLLHAVTSQNINNTIPQAINKSAVSETGQLWNKSGVSESRVHHISHRFLGQMSNSDYTATETIYIRLIVVKITETTFC